MDNIEKIEKILDELEKLEFHTQTFDDKVLGKKFTFLFDKKAFLFAVLVNGVLESDFNTDYLSKFDDFHASGEYLKFITNYPYYERG